MHVKFIYIYIYHHSKSIFCFIKRLYLSYNYKQLLGNNLKFKIQNLSIIFSWKKNYNAQDIIISTYLIKK